MKKMFAKLPGPPPAGAVKLADLRLWLMDALFVCLLLLFPISMLVTIPALMHEGSYLLIGFDIAALVYILISIFSESKRHNPFAWILIVYVFILSGFLLLGPYHARPGWLVMSGVVAALLFNTRAVIFVTLVNALMLTLMYTVGPPANAAWVLETRTPASTWIMFVGNISMLTLVSGLPVCFLLGRLEAALDHQRKALAVLAEEQDKLKNAYGALQEEVEARSSMGEALAASEERYRTLLENIPLGVFRVTSEGKLISANPAFVNMFGYSTQDIESGIFVADFYCDLDRRSRMLRQLETTGIVREMDFQFRRKNGDIFWGAIDASKVEDADGRFVYIDGILTDIQARRLAEEALQESERQFRDLVENAFAGIVIMVDDRVVYMNPEQWKIVGRKEAPAGLSEFGIHPDDMDKFMGYYQTVKRAGTSLSGMELRLCPEKKRPGIEKWVHCRINMIQYQGHSAALITMVDTTRTKELEEIVHLREKMASLGHVAAGIAHEIRNPLSGINVLLSGIKENFEDPDSADDIKKLIREAEKASEKISAVIRRVLDFSRPSKPHFVPLDISIPVSEAVALSRTALRKKGITIETDFASGLPAVYADGQMIEQVMLNLINNAVLAMRTVDREKQIQIRILEAERQVCLTVSDSGVGVPLHQSEKIFDPFFTTRPDGSGIGLSLCQRIVSDHGGIIRVGTSKWGGAEFEIKLPIDKRAHQR